MRNMKLNYKIGLPIEDCWRCFADLQQFAKFHPFMVSVKKLSPTEYEIKEKVWLWGFIPMAPTYIAKVVELEKEKQLEYISQVKKNVHLHIHFEFQNGPDLNHTSLIETINISCNPFIAFVFSRLLKKAHKKAIENLISKEKK